MIIYSQKKKEKEFKKFENLLNKLFLNLLKTS